jgi:diguanylate cyclase (GGDEF)-like protein
MDQAVVQTLDRSKGTPVTGTPFFLDRLVNLTAVQDLEMMEYSLLRTIDELVDVEALEILKFDLRGEPVYRLELSGDEYELAQEDVVVDEATLEVVDSIRAADGAFVQQPTSDRVTTAWEVLQGKSQYVVLIATSTERLDESSMHLVGGLLGVYRNYHRVLSESHLDPLTGLANRKTFEDAISKIHEQRPAAFDAVRVDRRAGRDETESGFWLGIADLDHFKRINDTWGHLYGDEVLLLTSRLMRDHFRRDDYLFRFGGEEFVIIVSAPSKEQAYTAFERFRLAMEHFTFPQIGRVTLSIGITRLEPGAMSATLVDQADKALYHAKRTGRNRVCSYEDLVASGLVEEKEIATGEIEMF